MKDYLKEKVITKHSKGLLATGKTKDTLVQSEKRPTCSGKNEKKKLLHQSFLPRGLLSHGNRTNTQDNQSGVRSTWNTIDRHRERERERGNRWSHRLAISNHLTMKSKSSNKVTRHPGYRHYGSTYSPHCIYYFFLFFLGICRSTKNHHHNNRYPCRHPMHSLLFQ